MVLHVRPPHPSIIIARIADIKPVHNVRLLVCQVIIATLLGTHIQVEPVPCSQHIPAFMGDKPPTNLGIPWKVWCGGAIFFHTVGPARTLRMIPLFYLRDLARLHIIIYLLCFDLFGNYMKLSHKIRLYIYIYIFVRPMGVLPPH